MPSKDDQAGRREETILLLKKAANWMLGGGMLTSSKRCQVLGISQEGQEWQSHMSESEEARAKMPKGITSKKSKQNKKPSCWLSGCTNRWLIRVPIASVKEVGGSEAEERARGIPRPLLSWSRKQPLLPRGPWGSIPSTQLAGPAHKLPRWGPECVQEIEKLLVLSTPPDEEGW